MKNLIAVFVFAALAMAGPRAFAQANVVENQKTYLYVNASTGRDSNSGSAAAPLKTIGAAAARALANNNRGAGTKVLISPGVYRESVYIQPSSQYKGAPITFQALTSGTAILDGSDVLTGWRSISGNEYAHAWRDTLGSCYAPVGWTGLQSIVLNNEMVFVNGAPLTQILSASHQRPGTFFVTSGELYVWPPSGTNMNAARVEVAARKSTLEVHGSRNMVFRGLAFRHAGSCVDKSSASVFSSNNILFDRVQATWNNWGGVAVSTSNNTTVQNSVASYNGGVGFVSFASQNALYQYDESDYNNWRGAMGALYDFGQGGTKLMRMHGGHVVQHYSYRNQGQGLWFDTDNKNITISNATLSENLGNNLQLEASEGPVALQNSSLCSSPAAGLQLINTAGLTATGNNFYNNGGTAKWQAQFFLAGNPGGRSINDWQTGQPYHIYSSNTTLSYNLFTDASANQYLFSTYTTGNDWAQFARSLHSSGNTWSDAQDSTAFRVPGSSGDSLNGWQNLTGQDHNSSSSRSAQAARNCAVPAPAYPDFNVSADKRTYSMSRGVATIALRARSFGFGAATLSTAALPYGVSASFSTSTLTNGPSVLTLRASSRAGYETVPVTIFAVSGSRVHSVTVSVAVSP